MIHTFKDNQGVAKAFADYLYEQINKKSETIHIALSGGSTPKILFQLLAEKYATKIDWTTIHLYWGDERCVPPDHEQSNYKMTQEKLLQYINIPFVNVHRVLGRRDPEEEATRYGKEIIWNLPIKEGLPHFDIIILGMGEDGHTASIFPHQMELLHNKNICAVATHPETGQYRVTLTGPVINNAEQIHFLVTGAKKYPILHQIVTKSGSYLDYPAAHIKNAQWWTDESALKGA